MFADLRKYIIYHTSEFAYEFQKKIIDTFFSVSDNYFEISAFKVFFDAHFNELEAMNELTILNVFYIV